VLNWISNVVRPKIRNFLNRREVPENLWVKCPETGQMVFHKDLEANQYVIPGSGYHMRMSVVDRLKTTFDDGAYDEVALPEVVIDPLKFRDSKRYPDRLRAAIDSGMYATDVAVEAAIAGVPFREAYRAAAAASDTAGQGRTPEASLAARVSPGAAADLKLEVLLARWEGLEG